MFEFLVETYAPGESPSTLAERAGELARAAERVSEPEAAVRLLGAVLVPEEEICFYLYEAVSSDAVAEAVKLAGLRPERIVQAVSVRATEHRRPDAAINTAPTPEK